MPLIKKRPKVGLRLPTILTPGRRASGVVVITASKAVPTQAVTVDLRGEERVVIGSGDSAKTHRWAVMTLRANLTGPEEIPAGRHELPFSFDVPEEAPPSYRFGFARVEYEAVVRVDIDWWPDAVEKFVITVGSVERDAVDARPQIYSTSPEGPVGTVPVLEVSLASDIVPLGGTIDVAVAVDNAVDTRFREGKLSLSALETRFDSRGRNRGRVKLRGYELRFSVERLLEGAPIRMAVPEVPPSIQSRLFQLDWVLDVTAVVAFGRDITMRLPVTLVPEGGVRVRSRLAPAPVGSSRQRAIWEKVARAYGMAFDGRQMLQKVGDVEIAIGLGHRKRGLALVGTLTHPSVHLDLDGGEKGSFHRFLGENVELGQPFFEKNHYVTGRDPAQVRAYVGALGEAFFAQELEDLDDEGMTFVSMRRTRSALSRMCSTLTSLAASYPGARAAIPPPSGREAAAAEWARTATREGAVFEPSRLALHFRRGEDRSIVVTEWDESGTAYRTTAAIEVRDPIDDDYLFLSTASSLGDDEATKYGAEARQILARLVAETPHLRVEERALIAHIEPQLDDPARALAILKRLEALSALLRGRTGPYR